MAGRPPIQRDEQGDAIRADMARGAMQANKFWDSYCVHAPRASIVGFLTRVFALYAAATSPEDTLLMFESVRRGVESLRVVRQPKKGH